MSNIDRKKHAQQWADQWPELKQALISVTEYIHDPQSEINKSISAILDDRPKDFDAFATLFEQLTGEDPGPLNFWQMQQEIVAWTVREKARAKLVAAATKKLQTPPAAATPEETELRLIPEGFSFHGKKHRLTGRPYQLLEALLKSRTKSARVGDLCSAMGIEPVDVDYPEQVVKDAAAKLKKALNKATKKAGTSTELFTSTGRGGQLAYSIATK